MDLEKFANSKIGSWLLKQVIIKRLVSRCPNFFRWIQASSGAIILIAQVISDNALGLGLSSEIANYITTFCGGIILVARLTVESKEQTEIREEKKTQKRLAKEIKTAMNQ